MCKFCYWSVSKIQHSSKSGWTTFRLWALLLLLTGKGYCFGNTLNVSNWPFLVLMFFFQCESDIILSVHFGGVFHVGGVWFVGQAIQSRTLHMSGFFFFRLSLFSKNCDSNFQFCHFLVFLVGILVVVHASQWKLLLCLVHFSYLITTRPALSFFRT